VGRRHDDGGPGAEIARGARDVEQQQVAARIGHVTHGLWPAPVSRNGKPTVKPARISLTGWPPVSASRKPTSKLSLSFTCQIAPTKPETVRATPTSSSTKNSATGRTFHLIGPSTIAPRKKSAL